jgi:hypothetical protein
MSTPYKGQFSVGTKVRIRRHEDLKEFQREWKYHNPLTNDQVAFADKEAMVKDIGYYHGGDVLYELEGIPGVWHEQCLAPA